MRSASPKPQASRDPVDRIAARPRRARAPPRRAGARSRARVSRRSRRRRRGRSCAGSSPARSARRSTPRSLAEMLARPAQQRAEAPAGPVQLQQRRELRLAAGPAVVDHQLLRGPRARRLAEILGDHGQRQVDAGGDAGRGPDVAVLDEDAVGLEPRPRESVARTRRAVSSGWSRACRRAGRRRPARTRRSRRWPRVGPRVAAARDEAQRAAGRAPPRARRRRRRRSGCATRGRGGNASAISATPDELAHRAGPSPRASRELRTRPAR